MLKPRKRVTRRKIKEDKLVTTYFKAVDFLKVNSQKLTIAAIAVLAVIVLVLFFMRSKRAAEFKASAQMAKANLKISQNKTQEAIDILLSLVDNYSGTKSASIGVYMLAKTFYEKGEFDKANINFEKYLHDYGSDKILASAAYSGVGACLEQQEKYLEAAKSYEQGAKKYPDHFNAPQQLMDAGRCYTLSNQFAQAKDCYKLVVDKYSTSGLRNDAELYLAKLRG